MKGPFRTNAGTSGIAAPATEKLTIPVGIISPLMALGKVVSNFASAIAIAVAWAFPALQTTAIDTKQTANNNFNFFIFYSPSSPF
jgi:hypothetical protein